MNNSPATDKPSIELIEKDYINSMLGIDCPVPVTKDIKHELVDYKKVYESDSFECQVFNIAGLHIAVPASNLRQTLSQQLIVENTADNSRSTICAGHIKHDEEDIEVIDIEALAMNGSAAAETMNRYKNTLLNIALIKGATTGFICNEQLDAITILKTQVHWRDADSERIWLAGTVAQMGLALLDIEGLIKLAQRRS
jgi:hypothetical protein